MQNTRTRKILNIQGLRGIAVLLVVLFHLVTIEQKFGGSRTILPDFFQFGMFGVDLFFVISGFVMVTVTRGKFRRPCKALTFLYHRATRIYPLYWFYSLLVLAVYLYNPAMVNSSQGSQVNILASFLLLPQAKLPLLMVGWTLVHEMYFYLVFFLLLFLPGKYLLPGLATWAVAILLFQSQAAASGSPPLVLVTHPLTLEFIGGCLVAMLTAREKSPPLHPGLALTAGLLILVGAVLLFMYHWQITGAMEPLGWNRILLLGLPALLLVYLAVKAEQQQLTLPGSLCRVGDFSYSIYLSHVLSLNLLGKIWALFAVDSIIDNILVLPFMVLAVIAVGAASYLTIERPMIILSRKLA